MPFRKLTSDEIAGSISYDRFNDRMVFVAGSNRFQFKQAPSTSRFRPYLTHEERVMSLPEMKALLVRGGAYIEVEVPSDPIDAEWHKPLTEKGPWVKVTNQDAVAALTTYGEYAYIEPSNGEFMWSCYSRWNCTVSGIGTLEECLETFGLGANS